jgi:type IV secretory pathway VirD2 relaxase
MTGDDDFEVKPGRIRQSRARSGTALRQVLGSVQRAGGFQGGRAARASVFGRGRAGGVQAVHRLAAGHRSVVIKTRIVRHVVGAAPLSAHLRYLQRDGVTQDGAPGRLFDAREERADPKKFGARCDGDRHHFRFIVSPEDGAELQDLKGFTRDLMRSAERDLGTGLDWVAVEHWNTGHPHVHILVRGVTDRGDDLVMSRDYIAQGLRARASELVTRELGPRTEHDIRRSLARDVASDRWTRLDGLLVREAARADGRLDVRPGADRASPGRALKIARLETLHDLGVARPEGPGRWRLAPDAEATLKALGRRSDIIARLHRGLAAAGIDRPSDQIRAEDTVTRSVTARVLAQGLDDELKGSGYLVLDGLDGRVHHHRVRDLAELDVRVGAVVELAPLKGEGVAGRLALHVRADLSVDAQAIAEGATWLDRRLLEGRLVGPGAKPPTPGFGEAVAAALERRIDHLQSLGLAQRQDGRVRLRPHLLETLRDRDLAGAGRRLTAETGLEHRPAAEGETVSGTYRRRVTLASGRFAMIDDGLGFTLVPWRPALERQLGQSVSGVTGPGRSIDWSPTRSRGPGR